MAVMMVQVSFLELLTYIPPSFRFFVKSTFVSSRQSSNKGRLDALRGMPQRQCLLVAGRAMMSLAGIASIITSFSFFAKEQGLYD